MMTKQFISNTGIRLLKLPLITSVLSVSFTAVNIKLQSRHTWNTLATHSADLVVFIRLIGRISALRFEFWNYQSATI